MVAERKHPDEYASQINPFDITKAVDFTDQEINTMWVDWPAPGGFAEFVSINSPMSRIIRGGKGTGRTHLMRHFSAPVQTIRGNGRHIDQIRSDGVLGIYVQCSGLNSSRFRGRGIDSDTWNSLFAQFMDVWLAQSALQAFQAVQGESTLPEDAQNSIVKEISELLNSERVSDDASLDELAARLFEIQKKIDVAVNNAALHRSVSLQLEIASTPGALVYGVPRVLRTHCRSLKDITFLYLIDEFENFEAPQQRYINSLIREKPPGISFVVGVRTYGLKTLKTIAGGEENRPGSEFEWIDPDQHYTVARGSKTYNTYKQFCSKVVARRLAASKLFNDEIEDDLDKRLRVFFEIPRPDFEEYLMRQSGPPERRPYLERLRTQLREYGRNPDGSQFCEAEIGSILDAVSVPERPLFEKANALLLYQAWSQGDDLKEVAYGMRCAASAAGQDGPNATSAQERLLEKFGSDLKAQLCHDLGRRPIYAGFEQFVEMSDGLPRNLLVMLKYIHRWSLFNEEAPFQSGQVISIDSQMRGLLDAADWFLDDAKPLGREGDDVIDAIVRLCNMFRQFRYSDKLVESSLTSFSGDLTRCSERARNTVKLAEQWSLLVKVEGGQKERNSGLIEPKYQVNRLLSPRWDLPTARRGAIRFTPEEVNAIFDADDARYFQQMLNRRLARMTVPFGSVRKEDGVQHSFEMEGYQGG